MAKWIKTKFPGIRYREHDTRKHGIKKDQYFTIRYKLAGKDREEGLGWASEGMTGAKAYSHLTELKENQKVGEGPQTLAEKRALEQDRREMETQGEAKAKRESITFGKFVTDTYLPQSKRDKKPTSYTTEEILYRIYLAPTLADLPFSKITAFHLERIKKNMKDLNRSDRTIQYVLQTIRHIFYKARKLYKGESPTKDIKWPKLDNAKMGFLSVTQAEELLDALAMRSRTLHDISLLSLHVGLRFGEIAALTWSCVNWTEGSLAILNGKTGSRTAFLTKKAMDMLRNRTQGQTNDLIFLKQPGKGPMVQVSKAFSDTVEKLGFNRGVTDRKLKITFHSLRHTFATHLYDSTQDIYLTQKSLGHTTSTMTQRYAKMTDKRLKEGVAALEKTLAGKSTEQEEQTEQESQVVNK